MSTSKDMPLPEFNSIGDLPEGVHKASLDEVLARFGQGTPQRQLVTAKLLRVLEVAKRTGKLERFVIFGSYITNKPAPNDVDIILVMQSDFLVTECDEQTAGLFDNLRVHEEFGASVFYIRTTTVLLETVDEFIAYWQTKRDMSLRGIVEIILEDKQ
jgi:hypothetical protein